MIVSFFEKKRKKIKNYLKNTTIKKSFGGTNDDRIYS